ncbi:metallophosphoesterase family protein [Salinimicrobium oceani]|uniref:Serine/threonine protein phosphatase n=1 Tax=Salinimicrobium oceani TaxID=2722702 RepID=A0ABX1CX19_9FLAO|nr:metallophosphoesterase family protein [Salinimicrobium oceani]NJW52840.1 serine/threonine protein phosphatase [Salinimicrobium oceani]
MARTLVIGDIHGGLKALLQLLERAKVTPADKLIFLGDYVDGWSDSANVVSYLITLAKQNTCIFLRGNHDDLTHRWLKTGELNDQWLQHGGQSSIDAYRRFSEDQKKEHIIFFDQMVNYYIDKENRLFVHAGFTNQKGPAEEYTPTPFYWDRTLWEMAMCIDPNLKPGDTGFPKRLELFREIFIGHTPVTRIGRDQPTRFANVCNMDTGAAFMGKLSLMDVNSRQIFQSDPVHSLYPDESGRN